jgi:hypothetical protein
VYDSCHVGLIRRSTVRKTRIRVLWVAVAAAFVLGTLATPALAKAAWQGLQLDASIAIDTAQAKAEIPMEIDASAFAFKPVLVTVEDHPKKSAKTLHIKLTLRNQSEKDYYMYATANLLDAEAKIVATKNKKVKADDHDNASVSFEFKLSYADAARVKKCGFRFAFEKE